MTDGEMVIYLHNIARKTEDEGLHIIADRLDELRPKNPGTSFIDRSEEAREVMVAALSNE